MILCCGEALVDMLPRRTTEDQLAYQPFSGGAVFNTAIAVSRLDVPTGLFTGLSTDLFGELLATTLSESGVDTALVARSGRPTTLAFLDLDDGQARYSFYDENTAGRMLSENDLPVLPDDVEALFFGGISLAVEPCGRAYERLMLNAGQTRVTMIDPNIRPGFIADESAYRARLERMLKAADIVKLSDEDLRWIVGPGTTQDGATALLARGPAVVFVTEGARGAWGFTAQEQVFQTAADVNPIDTVGAGDTFNAGLLASLHENRKLNRASLARLEADNLSAALSLAARAAAVTVSRAGANPPRREELA